MKSFRLFLEQEPGGTPPVDAGGPPAGGELGGMPAGDLGGGPPMGAPPMGGAMGGPPIGGPPAGPPMMGGPDLGMGPGLGPEPGMGMGQQQGEQDGALPIPAHGNVWDVLEALLSTGKYKEQKPAKKHISGAQTGDAASAGEMPGGGLGGVLGGL